MVQFQHSAPCRKTRARPAASRSAAHRTTLGPRECPAQTRSTASWTIATTHVTSPSPRVKQHECSMFGACIVRGFKRGREIQAVAMAERMTRGPWKRPVHDLYGPGSSVAAFSHMLAQGSFPLAGDRSRRRALGNWERHRSPEFNLLVLPSLTPGKDCKTVVAGLRRIQESTLGPIDCSSKSRLERMAGPTNGRHWNRN